MGDIKGRKVNHSTRKTFATSLVQAGVPPTEIAQLGGWKNVQSINEYAVPSIEQQEKSSNILSNILLPDNSENMSSEVMLPEPEKHVESNSLIHNAKRSSSYETSNYESQLPFCLFRGATISGGTININVMPSQKKMKYSQSESVSNSQE